MEQKTEESNCFKSWEEIFPNPETRQVQLGDFIQDIKNEYMQNGSFEKEEVVVQKKTKGVKLTRHDGNFTVILELPNMNIELINCVSQQEHVDVIVPGAGISRHNWSYDQIRKVLRHALFLKDLSLKEKNLDLMSKFSGMGDISFAIGKPATLGWVGEMQYMNFTPIRVGFKIYPLECLENIKKTVDEQKNRIINSEHLVSLE